LRFSSIQFSSELPNVLPSDKLDERWKIQQSRQPVEN
jgi:hypothetical protein